MIRLPFSQQQLVWLFRLSLLLVLVTVSWFAFTSSPIRSVALVNDKVNHGFAFFVLAYFIDNAFPRWRFLLVKVWPLLAYGVLIEIVQRYVARDSSYLDLGADAVGITLYWCLRRWLRQLITGRAPAASV